MAKYRLTARAQIDGHLREPGFVFELADGVLGPHRGEILQHDTIDVENDSTRRKPMARDVPLYVPVED